MSQQRFYGSGNGFWRKYPTHLFDLNDSGRFAPIEMLDYLLPDCGDEIVKIECQYDSHMFILSKKGRIYSFGKNSPSGVLGLGDCEPRQLPLEIPTFSNDFHDPIINVETGLSHVLFLTRSGKVWSCGDNGSGQLAHLLRKECKIPVEIDSKLFDSPVERIFCGPKQSFFISQKGTVYGCGLNDVGQVCLFSDDFIDITYPDNCTVPTDLRTALPARHEKIQNIICGYSNTCLLFEDGEIAVCGSYCKGTEYFDTKYTPIEKCYSCYNYNYRFVTDPTYDKDVKKMIFCKYNRLVLLRSGILMVYGNPGIVAADKYLEGIPIQLYGEEEPESDRELIDDVYCGEFHIILKTNKRRLFSVGNNNLGQLSLGHTSSRTIDKLITECEIPLPFTWEEGDDVTLFTHPYSTILVHKKCEHKYPTHVQMARSLVNNLSKNDFNKVNPDSPIHSFMPLIMKMSPSLHTLLQNKELISSLDSRGVLLLQKLVEFTCLNLSVLNSVEDESLALDLLYTYCNATCSDMKDCQTMLFILNDLSDIGTSIKHYVFSEFSNKLDTSNVLTVIEDLSNLLSLKVLKRSDHSIMLLAVQKCLVFIKKHQKQIENEKQGSIILSKLEKRLEKQKENWSQLIVSWEEPTCGCLDLNQALVSLFNDKESSDLKYTIDSSQNTTIHLHKSVISHASPVLAVLFENENFADFGSTLDLFQFISMMDTSRNIDVHITSNTLEFILRMCYTDMTVLNGLSLEQLLPIVAVAHQLQIEPILQECCSLLVNQISLDKMDEMLHMATVLEGDPNGRNFSERLVWFFANHVPQRDLQLFIDRQPILSDTLFKKIRTMQDLIAKKKNKSI